MEAPPRPSPPQVIYETAHITLGHRLVVAVGVGAMAFATMAFLRGGGGVWAIARWYAAVAALVTGALVVAAFRSRTVWRVTLDAAARELRLDRDPDAQERWTFEELTDAGVEPVVGGWSRDPADRLVLRARDGRRVVYALPDDALTTGIAKDIRKALSPGSPEAGKDVAEDPAGRVAGAGEVREQGVEGAPLGAVAVAEAAGDGDRGGG